MSLSGLRLATVIVASVGICSGAVPAPAQLLEHKDLTASIAITIAQTAIETCKANGYAVSATVVGRNGEIIVQVRGDNTPPHTMENSFRKAYTARTLRSPSGALGRSPQSRTDAAASSISATSSRSRARCRSSSATKPSAPPAPRARPAARRTKPASRPGSTRWQVS